MTTIKTIFASFLICCFAGFGMTENTSSVSSKPTGDKLGNIKYSVRMYNADEIDQLTTKTYPALFINMREEDGDVYTDFIVKASTNNFETICYCFVSFYDRHHEPTNSLNLMNKYFHHEVSDIVGENGTGPGCYYLDTMASNSLAFIEKTDYHHSIYDCLIDKASSIVPTCLLTPSHFMYNQTQGGYPSWWEHIFEDTTDYPISEASTLSWMYEENVNLSWRYLRCIVDSNVGVINSEKTENGQDMWRTIQPKWYLEKYDPTCNHPSDPLDK